MKQAIADSKSAASDFATAYRGEFKGILQWSQLDQFWRVLRSRADAGWYIYAVGTEVPDAPRSAAEVRDFVDEIDALLRKEHDEDYCGIVYTDSKESPTFVKIFDPNNLGVSCGYSNNPPPPGWILSLIPPAAIDPGGPLAGNRRRWWQRLWPAS
jgi:hypothetical protein